MVVRKSQHSVHLDVVGLDTFAHVAKNVYEKVQGEEQKVFEVPAFMNKMLEKGWLGSKTGQGFFLKKGKEILRTRSRNIGIWTSVKN